MNEKHTNMNKKQTIHKHIKTNKHTLFFPGKHQTNQSQKQLTHLTKLLLNEDRDFFLGIYLVQFV
jgi:hypothetical protein